jgi:hypothetical protein
VSIKRVTAVLHKLDHAVGRMRPRRSVLIEVRTPVYLAVLGPIAEALCAWPDVDVHFTSEYPDRIRPLVPDGRFLTRQHVEWRRFDLYLNADPWAAVRVRRCGSRVNFFHGVAGKYDLDKPQGLPMGFETYDAVAFINRDRMERYLAANIVTPKQAVLVGYPKLDRLAQGGWDGKAVREAIGLDTGRPTVLYAPTYSKASSLHLAGEAIIRSLDATGFNVLVKLHDRSLDSDPRYNSGIDWRSRLAPLMRPGRVHLIDEADCSPLLAAADLLVTDHSSVGFEYLVLDRPLLVFDAPELPRIARINPEKVELLRSAATIVRTADELSSAAVAELIAPSRLSARRRQIADQMFYEPGRATERALTLVSRLLATRGVSASVERSAGAPSLTGGVS